MGVGQNENYGEVVPNGTKKVATAGNIEMIFATFAQVHKACSVVVTFLHGVEPPQGYGQLC